jgi:hypothetical protein
MPLAAPVIRMERFEIVTDVSLFIEKVIPLDVPNHQPETP